MESSSSCVDADCMAFRQNGFIQQGKKEKTTVCVLWCWHGNHSACAHSVVRSYIYIFIRPVFFQHLSFSLKLSRCNTPLHRCPSGTSWPFLFRKGTKALVWCHSPHLFAFITFLVVETEFGMMNFSLSFSFSCPLSCALSCHVRHLLQLELDSCVPFCHCPRMVTFDLSSGPLAFCCIFPFSGVPFQMWAVWFFTYFLKG